jgi:hypothetical protein
MPMLGPIVPDSPLTSLVSLDLFLETAGFGIVQTILSKQIQVLWALPITETERQYLVDKGAVAFYQLFDPRQPGATIDFYRNPLV